MTMTSIADALKAAPGTLLDGCRGVIKTVGEYNAGVYNPPGGGKPEPYSIQIIIFTGKNGEEIAASIAHHDKIEADMVGKFVWLLAHQKSTGGKSGLKVVDEDGRPMLRVSKSAEVVFSPPGSAVPPPPVIAPEPISTSSAREGSSGARNTPNPSSTVLPLTTGVSRAVRAGSTAPTGSSLSLSDAADLDQITHDIDRKIALYKLIRTRLVNGVGEQLPDQDCVDRATKTIFDSMLLCGPF
jgi:hypothetical protein